VDRVPVGVIRIDIDGPVATFRRVAVRDDVQRRGHGRRLLEAAERFARRKGCTRIESHVAPDAARFYERCGFTPSDAAQTPTGSVLMSKTLD
jgi:GNAT superfamily N-acetyltransferase